MKPSTIKKIVILSPAHPLRGGIASSTERLAQEWQAMGGEVRICSFKMQYPGFLFPGKTQYTDAPPPKDLEIKAEVNSVNPFNWLIIGRQLKKERPDLIIVRYWLPFMGPATGTILRIARSNGHTRVIAIVDNMIPHEKRPGDQLFSSYFTGAVDGFIAMSRSVVEDIRQFTSTKPVSYIPHPIYDNYGNPVSREESLEELNLASDKRYLLFFGFIRKYKGLDLLLKAMADPRVRSLDLRLIVAGEFYADPEEYQAIIDRLGLEKSVLLYNDFIPEEKVRYYFGVSDLVVQPYKTATQSGISQLAYHFEKPMIVTRVGGLPEIVEDGKVGYVVDVKVDAIADAIMDYFQQARMAKMTEGVRENKKLFSWARMVDGIREVYQSL